MTALDTTDMEATANISFEDFKTNYHDGTNTAAQYYEDLQNAASAAGQTNTFRYGELGEGVAKNNTTAGKAANDYSEVVGDKNSIDFSIGSDAWLEMQWNLMQNDLNTRLDQINNHSGTGELDYQLTNQIHTDAFNDVGLPPETFTLHTPTSELGKVDPNLAQALFEDMLNNAHSGGGLFLDVLGIDVLNGWAHKTNSAYLDWLGNLTHALANHPLDLGGSLLNDLVNALTPAQLAALWSEHLPTNLGSSPYDYLSPVWIPGVTSLYGLSQATGSPLVLDLGTGGIQLTALNSSGSAYWDIDQDGFREASGWIAGNTALLAIDKNSDGIINDNGELFGNTVTYANGFANLAQYDSNADGHITSADTHYGDLIVWTDDNHDGYSQSGELHSLSSLSIADISLTYASSSATINGNAVKQVGTFTMGGVSHAMADVWFSYDDVNSTYNEDYTLDIRTLFMPDMRGFGVLPDLHIAMSSDNTGTGNLLAMIQDISAQSLSDILDPAFDLKGEITDILYRWAGVDGVSPSSRGPYADAQQLGFLEALTGHNFLQVGGLTNPGVNATANLNAAWEAAMGAIGGHILLQAGLGNVFGNPEYNPLTDTFSGSLIADGVSLRFNPSSGSDSIYGTALNEVYVFHAGDSPTSSPDRIYESLGQGTDTILFGGVDPADVHMWTDGANYLYIQYTSTDMIKLYGQNSGGENNIANYVERIAFDNGTVWDLTAGLQHMTDSNDGNTLNGSSHADTIDGRGGGDTIHGYGGNDTLIGGTATDFLYGGVGDDTYVFTAGDSPTSTPDRIYESLSEGADTIFFSGVDPADVRMWTDSANYLYIQYTTTDTIKIYGQNSGGENNIASYVEHIAFDDSTVWDLTAGLQHMTDSNDGNTLNGSSHADTIDGRGGSDTIHGYGGNDTVIGGTGTDFLYGGIGNDTYVFNAGDSPTANPDRIYESLSEGTDTIFFNGVDPDDVRMWTDSANYLYIQYTTTDTIKLYGQNSGGENHIASYVEHIAFDDSTVWDLTLGLQHMTDSDDGNTLNGSALADVIDGRGGSDTIYGYGGDDTLIGGTGTNYLYGGTGADIFAFNAISSTNNVQDFSTVQGDKLDVSALLDLYNPLTHAITDFVQITTSGANSLLSVDLDGLGSTYSFQQIATISSVTGLTDEAALLTAGTLIV